MLLDPELDAWRLYGNRGWPGRYLFDRTGKLALIHYGEGDYEDTERAIGECLELEVKPLEPLRPRTPRACCWRRRRPTSPLPADRERLTLVRDWEDGEDWIEAADAGAAASFSYEAGAAFAVLSGGGREPGLYESAGTVEADSPGLRLHGVQFTPIPPSGASGPPAPA